MLYSLKQYYLKGQNLQLMRLKIIVVLMLISSGYVAMAQSADEKEIRSVLDKQTQEWNRGNIDAFMVGYWNNDSLMFVGQSGVTYGYEQTKNNYKKNYSDTAKMGKLTFNILQVKPLSADYYFVLGKWYLKRSVGDVSGHYTLIFRKINGKWLIISDHSS
jgi:ketosteroid isomerase-like protein